MNTLGFSRLEWSALPAIVLSVRPTPLGPFSKDTSSR